jgi:hypothetical protein
MATFLKKPNGSMPVQPARKSGRPINRSKNGKISEIAPRVSPTRKTKDDFLRWLRERQELLKTLTAETQRA